MVDVIGFLIVVEALQKGILGQESKIKVYKYIFFATALKPSLANPFKMKHHFPIQKKEVYHYLITLDKLYSDRTNSICNR